jgi:hypothetical protein
MLTLADVRLALRITTNAFDKELSDLMSAACLDLGIAGVNHTCTGDPLVKRAVITYVKMHFGQPDEYDRLKKSYDEQKAQLATATGYTNWGVNDGQE